jgi:tight adherence protein C
MTLADLHDFRLEHWLPAGVGSDDLIAALAALAVLATLVMIWQAVRPNSPFERRLAQIIDSRELLRRSALASRTRTRQWKHPVNWMHQALGRLNLLRSRHAAEARASLARAGIRSQEAMVGYLFAQVSLPPLLGLVVVLDTYALHLTPGGPKLRFAASIGAVLLGFFAPRLYLRNAADKRAKQLKRAMPDGLDLMVICAEAGLSLDATLVRVARELAGAWPELAEEFAITAAELTFLPDRRQAFDNLNIRTNTESIRAVVNTLQQTAKFGTPLSQSLRVLAAEMRTMRMTAAEEKAARLPALLTVPMMLFILPTLFIVLLGPAAIGIIDTFANR